MTTLYKRRWTDPTGKVREAYRVQFKDDMGKQRSRQFSTLRAAKSFQTAPVVTEYVSNFVEGNSRYSPSLGPPIQIPLKLTVCLPCIE